MSWQTIHVPLHPRTRRTADGTYYTHDGTGRLRVRGHHLNELGRQGGVMPPNAHPRVPAHSTPGAPPRPAAAPLAPPAPPVAPPAPPVAPPVVGPVLDDEAPPSKRHRSSS